MTNVTLRCLSFRLACSLNFDWAHWRCTEFLHCPPQNDFPHDLESKKSWEAFSCLLKTHTVSKFMWRNNPLSNYYFSTNCGATHVDNPYSYTYRPIYFLLKKKILIWLYFTRSIVRLLNSVSVQYDYNILPPGGQNRHIRRSNIMSIELIQKKCGKNIFIYIQFNYVMVLLCTMSERAFFFVSSVTSYTRSLH